jgi:hypothetical protein
LFFSYIIFQFTRLSKLQDFFLHVHVMGHC